MKRIFVLPAVLVLIVLGIWGCKSDKTVYPTFDERDAIMGTYTGIGISSHWVYDNPGGAIFRHDTTNVTMRLDKSDQATLVKLYMDNAYYGDFTFYNSNFTSTQPNHPPTLVYTHDSLYYHDQPSPSANYYDSKAKRQR
jgi:hypothetical protein